MIKYVAHNIIVDRWLCVQIHIAVSMIFVMPGEMAGLMAAQTLCVMADSMAVPMPGCDSRFNGSSNFGCDGGFDGSFNAKYGFTTSADSFSSSSSESDETSITSLFLYPCMLCQKVGNYFHVFLTFLLHFSYYPIILIYLLDLLALSDGLIVMI